MLGTLTPPTGLAPPAGPSTELGRCTEARPFGLTLSRPSPETNRILDLTGAALDPVTQILVGATGDPVAGKPTSQKITTNYKTVHDHSSWNDTKNDTYPD